MTTTVTTDKEITVLEQLDFPFPCKRTGDHAAELFMHCKRCSEGVALCRDHYAKAREHVEEYLSQFLLGVVTCAECKSTATAFDELVAVVPL